MADFLIREGEIVFCKPIARAVLRDVDAFHLVHAVCEGRFFEGLASISENRVFQQSRPQPAGRGCVSISAGGAPGD